MKTFSVFCRAHIETRNRETETEILFKFHRPKNAVPCKTQKPLSLSFSLSLSLIAPAGDDVTAVAVTVTVAVMSPSTLNECIHIPSNKKKQKKKKKKKPCQT